MKRITLILVCSFLFSGCVTDGGFNSGPILGGPCGATVAGYTSTVIAYGDSTLVVVPISKIRPNTEWRFELVPITKPSDAIDYKNVKVEVIGKPSTVMTPGPNDWINVSGEKSTSSKGVLTLCVPATLPLNSYEYLVEVDSVGKLDPRARVIPD